MLRRDNPRARRQRVRDLRLSQIEHSLLGERQAASETRAFVMHLESVKDYGRLRMSIRKARVQEHINRAELEIENIERESVGLPPLTTLYDTHVLNSAPQEAVDPPSGTKPQT